MYQIHPRPDPLFLSTINTIDTLTSPSGSDGEVDPVPEFETNFVPSKQAPHFVQQFNNLHTKLSKVQRHIIPLNAEKEIQQVKNAKIFTKY